MNDPKRWLDDARVPEDLRSTLARAGRTRELDDVIRARVGARVRRLGALPFATAAWPRLKSAAALGLAAGFTAAGALAAAEHYHVLPFERVFAVGATQPSVPARPRAVSAPRGVRHAAPGAAKSVAVTSAPGAAESVAVTSAPGAAESVAVTSAPGAAARPAPGDVPPSVPATNPGHDLPRSAQSARVVAPPAASATDLGEESALLERARRALTSAPAAALVLLREHAERFPRGQLGAERRLIEVEALDRVGRRSEALALGRQLLDNSGSKLYSERVERLLRKMNDAGEPR